MGFFSHGGSYGIQKVPMAWKILWIWGYHRVPPCRETSELEKPPQKRLWSTDLVGGLEHGFYDFPYIGNVIIPTDFHIFQRGRSTTDHIFFLWVYDISSTMTMLGPWKVGSILDIKPLWLFMIVQYVKLSLHFIMVNFHLWWQPTSHQYMWFHSESDGYWRTFMRY